MANWQAWLARTDARASWRALGAVRIVAALVFLSHGTMKMLGLPAQPAELAAMMHPGSLVWWSGLLELALGPLILVGLLTRPAALLASGEMAIGYALVHLPDGFWPPLNGGDAAILYALVFFLIAIAGPGAWSLDAAWLGRRGEGLAGRAT